MYAEVLIPLALPKNYTWSVPPQFRTLAKPGVRVEVGLGKNKKYSGVIKSILDTAPQAYETKDILNILDPAPVVFPEQMKFWEWIAS